MIFLVDNPNNTDIFILDNNEIINRPRLLISCRDFLQALSSGTHPIIFIFIQ